MANTIFRRLRKFRIPKTMKRVFNLIGGLFLASCCFFVAYLNFQNGWTDLKKVDKFEGIINEKGIKTYQTSTSGRYRMTLRKQAFYFKLGGLSQTLAVYNPQQNYSLLYNNVNIGDTVKVFYNSSNWVDKLNIETFQIEKNNKVLLNSLDFQGRERMVFYITLIGGLVLLFLTFYQERKFRLNE